MAEGIALRIFAAELVKLDGIGFRLGALGNDIHAEIMRQSDDRAKNNGPRALAIVMNEGPVDLNRIERKALEIIERRITGPEVIQGKASAEIMNASQDLRRVLRVFHDQTFGQLELEAPARNFPARQNSPDILQEVVPEQ